MFLLAARLGGKSAPGTAEMVFRRSALIKIPTHAGLNAAEERQHRAPPRYPVLPRTGQGSVIVNAKSK